MNAADGSRRTDRLAAFAAFLILAIVYGATAAPCAWWGDGLELSCAAWTLGIAHPPGYPLYTVVGHFWMIFLAPLMDPGRALTLFSSACLAVAGAVLVRLFASAAREPLAGMPGKPRSERTGGVAAGLLTALALAFSRTVWEHATFAEVYPLTFLLGALAVTWCWRWREDTVGILREDTRGPWRVDEVASTRTGAALGVIMGLLALNHYSGAAIGPLAVVAVLSWSKRNYARRRSILWTAGGVFALILTLGYAYLPLRAAANPPLNWGDPSSLGRFVWMIRGGQFAQFKVGGGAAASLAGMEKWLDWWGCQWLPGKSGLPAEPQMLTRGFLDPTLAPGSRWPQMLLGFALLAIATYGLIDLSRKRRALAYGLLASIAMTGFYAGFYHIIDIDAFFMIALPAAGIGWIIAARRAALLLKRLHVRLLRPEFLMAFGGLALAALVVSNWNWVSKHGDDAPLRWGISALDQVLPNGVIVTQGDNDIYALWYQQIVQRRRPDVSVIGSNFISSGWYQRYFDRPERPRVDVRIVDRKLPPDKLTFDVDLLGGTLLPNLKAGRAVLLTFDDPVYWKLFQPKILGPLLPASYYDWAQLRGEEGLPSPALYSLEPEKELSGMDDAALRSRLAEYYRRPAGSRP